MSSVLSSVFSRWEWHVPQAPFPSSSLSCWSPPAPHSARQHSPPRRLWQAATPSVPPGFHPRSLDSTAPLLLGRWAPVIGPRPFSCLTLLNMLQETNDYAAAYKHEFTRATMFFHKTFDFLFFGFDVLLRPRPQLGTQVGVCSQGGGGVHVAVLVVGPWSHLGGRGQVDLWRAWVCLGLAVHCSCAGSTGYTCVNRGELGAAYAER